MHLILDLNKAKGAVLGTNLGRGIRGLDSRDRTLPLFGLGRFREPSLDLAPPVPPGDRSLQQTWDLNQVLINLSILNIEDFIFSIITFSISR